MPPAAPREERNATEFLEYEEVYTDRFYGTLLAPVEHQLAAGQNVISDIDVKGALNFKRHYGDRCLTVFIQPPSIAALRDRLERRGTETAEAIQMRLDKAEYEMSCSAVRHDHRQRRAQQSPTRYISCSECIH